jgi:FkbM family methyltransferase
MIGQHSFYLYKDEMMTKKIINFIKSLLQSTPKIHPLNIKGISQQLYMEIHKEEDTHVSSYIREHHIWEPDETTLIKNILKPGQVFVDIGANIGYFSVLAASIVGSNGQIYAFEPEPRNFNLLNRNVKLNNQNNVDTHSIALSDKKETSKLYLNDKNLGDHQLFPNQKSIHRRAIEIEKDLGDNIFSAHPRVNFIKLDTQGSEYHVLMGLEETIKRSSPDLSLLLEFTPNALSTAGTNGRALLELLCGLKFEFYLLSKATLIPISATELDLWVKVTEFDSEGEGFTNILCVSTENKKNIGWKDLPVTNSNALDLLFGDPLETWNGLSCDHRGIGTYLYFRKGWEFDNSMIEDEASILFKPEPPRALEGIKLHLKGIYTGEREKIEVIVNNHSTGEHFIDDCVISLPTSIFFAEKTIISLKGKNSRTANGYKFQSISWECN